MIDEREYLIGVVTNAEMRALSLHQYKFHGDWICELYPR